MLASRKDIFLDFLSPDNRNIYGSYLNLTHARHKQLLSESLNISVLLCQDQCVLPPSFVTQDHMLRAVLDEKKAFLEFQLIFLPLREKSLGDFFEKKIREYSTVKKQYAGLFETEGRQFVENYSDLVKKRNTEMGHTIANKWESSPDGSALWRPIISELPVTVIEQLRKKPSELKNIGASVTWDAMKIGLPPVIEKANFFINQALQNEYINNYIVEYELSIIKNAPPKTTNFEIPIDSHYYDWTTFKTVISIISPNLWRILCQMESHSMVLLKLRPGAFLFLEQYANICEVLVTKDLIYREIAYRVASIECNEKNRLARGLEKIRNKTELKKLLTLKDIDLLENILLVAISSKQTKEFENVNSIFNIKQTDHDSMPAKTYKWDVFISHASEDKDLIARPLTEELKNRNLKVWFDEQTLEIGDSLREKIDEGLRLSKYGIVIISPNFIAKKWTNLELNGFFARMKKDEKCLLPLWHNISSSQVFDFSPMLSGWVAANTSLGVPVIADKIVDILKKRRYKTT
jgi:hypothetical protein